MAKPKKAHKRAAVIDPRQMTYDLIVGPGYEAIAQSVAVLNKNQRQIAVTLTKIEKGFQVLAAYKEKTRKKLPLAAFEITIKSNGMPSYALGSRLDNPEQGGNLDRDPTPGALLNIFQHWMRVNFGAVLAYQARHTQPV